MSKIALCGLSWFKLDVKMSKIKQCITYTWVTHGTKMQNRNAE